MSIPVMYNLGVSEVVFLLILFIFVVVLINHVVPMYVIITQNKLSGIRSRFVETQCLLTCFVS